MLVIQVQTLLLFRVLGNKIQKRIESKEDQNINLIIEGTDNLQSGRLSGRSSDSPVRAVPEVVCGSSTLPH